MRSFSTSTGSKWGIVRLTPGWFHGGDVNPARHTLALLLLPLVARGGAATRVGDALSLPPWRVEAARLLSGLGSCVGPSSLTDLSRLGERASEGLATALDGAPGVMLLPSFGGFEPPRLSIRGSGIQSAPSSRGILMALDGLPLNQADGSFNAALFDPGLGDRLDVSRGYDAAADAPGVMGGVIDLVRDDPPAGGANMLSLQAGSWGYVRATAGGAWQGTGDGVRADAAVQRLDGYRAHSTQWREAFAASGRAGPLRWAVHGVSLAYDVPGPLTVAQAYAAPQSVSAEVLCDQPRREASLIQASLGMHRRIDAGVADFALGIAGGNDWFRQLAANGLSRSGGGDVVWSGSLVKRAHLGDLAHELRVATRGAVGGHGLRRYANQSGAQGALFADEALRASTVSTSVDDRLDLGGRVSLTVGASWLEARRLADSRLSGSGGTLIRWSDARVLGRTRLTWAPSTLATAYVAWEQSAEPPTFDDLVPVSGSAVAPTVRVNPLLTQTAGTWECGVRGSHGAIDWDLCLYRGLWYNEILRLADANGLPRGAVNAGPTRHEGAETTLRWRILRGPRRLRLETTAMWTRAVFLGDPVDGGRRLAGLPPHQGRIELGYDDDHGAFAAVACDWTAGRTLADHAGRLGYGGEAVTSFRLGRRWPLGWSVFVQVDNLFGRRWIASTAGVLDVARVPASTAVFLPGTGRSVTVGVARRL